MSLMISLENVIRNANAAYNNMILKIMGDELLEITGITSNNPILIIDNATSQLTKKFPLRNFILNIWNISKVRKLSI